MLEHGSERQAQAWRHVTGNVEQHLITNSVDSVARLARTAQTTRDFTEFVVKPYLDVSGVRDAFMVDFIRRAPCQDDPIAACHDALFVVNRIAGVVHRLDRTPEETPRRTLCGVLGRC